MLIKVAKRLIYAQVRKCSVNCESVSNIDFYSPGSNCETRILKVAIIGLPNAGKSTLINNLIDRKVCAASEKVHTTRTKAHAIFTEGDAQIVFVDTPGLINDKEQKRFNLERTFIRDNKKVSQEADIIGVVHDVTNVWTRERLDIKAIKILDLQKSKPSFLILNKVDALKSKRKLLDLTRQLTDNHIDGKLIISGKPFRKQDSGDKGWQYFKEVFMVSALTGDGIQAIKDFLIQNAKPGEWMFPKDSWTDQSHQTLIENAVKAVLLDILPQELPYSMTVKMEYFKQEIDGSIITRVVVLCPNSRQASFLSKPTDGRLKTITQKAQSDLQETFLNYVNIQIVIVPTKKL